MKRIDLMPTDEQIASTLINDSIGRKADLLGFLKLIDSVEGPFSIFLDSPWGTGKTFFIRQAEMLLAANNPILGIDSQECAQFFAANPALSLENGPYLPFYFNAWENDDYDDPLCPLLASMAVEVDFDPTIGKSVKKKAAAIIDSIAGVAGISVGGVVDAFSGENLIEAYENRKALRDMFGDLVGEMLREVASKLVLFVDELDRCRPSFAIKLLEQMKALFDRDDVIVVYSTDRLQLANALQGTYGPNFDTLKYLERFYDMRFSLAPVDPVSYLGGTEYDLGGTRHYTEITSQYLKNYSITMRDANRILETLLAGQRYVHSKRFASTMEHPVLFSRNALLPTLIMMSYLDAKAWRDVRSGKNFETVYEFAKANEAFISYLDFCITKGGATPSIKSGDRAETTRSEYVRNVCVAVFVDNLQYREDPKIEELLWLNFDKDTIRTLSFPPVEKANGA